MIDYANSGALMFSNLKGPHYYCLTQRSAGLRVRCTKGHKLVQYLAILGTGQKNPQNAEGSDQITGQIAMIPFSTII